MPNQFADGEIREFQPIVSTKDYPANLKDISMWVPEGFNDNDFFDLIQNFEFATLIEEVRRCCSPTASDGRPKACTLDSKTFPPGGGGVALSTFLLFDHQILDRRSTRGQSGRFSIFPHFSPAFFGGC